MNCQEPLIRCASRCHILDVLICTFRFELSYDPAQGNFFDGLKCLLPFVGAKEILIRGSQLWSKAVKWVKQDIQAKPLVWFIDEMEIHAKKVCSLNVRHDLADLLGLAIVLRSDADPNPNRCLAQTMDSLWSNILSALYRPYSTLGVEFHIWVLASVFKKINSPQKRRGKDGFLHFDDVQLKTNDFFLSDFACNTASEVATLLPRHILLYEDHADHITYFDELLVVVIEILKLCSMKAKVFASTINCQPNETNHVVELFLKLTNEYEAVLDIGVGTTNSSIKNGLKRLSILSILGHDWWWRGRCKCYRFCYLNTRRQSCNECGLIEPKNFGEKFRELCKFEWISKPPMRCNFPSSELLNEEQKRKQISNRTEQQIWGSLQCQFVAKQWKCLRNWLIIHNEVSDMPNKVDNNQSEDWLGSLQNLENLMDSAACAVNTGGLEALVPVQNCVGFLTNHSNYYCLPTWGDERVAKTQNLLRKIVLNFIPRVKSAVFDARKNEEFWPAFEAFVEMSFGPNLLICDEFLDEMTQLAVELYAESENISGLACVLTKHLANIYRCKNIKFDFVKKIVALAALYGPIYKKDQIQYMKTNKFISERGGYEIPANYIEGSDHCLYGDLKAYTLHILFNIKRVSEDPMMELVTALVSEGNRLIGKRDQQYFENSFVHLVLTRMHQVLLCITSLSHIASENGVKELANICLNRIIKELGHQLSIRYLCEWTLISLATKNNNQFKQIIVSMVDGAFLEAKSLRPSCIPSYIVILSHVALISSESYRDGQENVDSSFAAEKIMEETMDKIAPWCMAPLFTTRLYAHVFMKKMFAAANVNGFQIIVEKYQIMDNCISQSLQQGDVDKNYHKIMGDFYLTSFDPVMNFNLENIFYDFPRLMNILPQEWVKKDILSLQLKGKLLLANLALL